MRMKFHQLRIVINMLVKQILHTTPEYIVIDPKFPKTIIEIRFSVIFKRLFYNFNKI